jgi:hypothetical protein
MDEGEILTHWALRFDGYKFCEETQWAEDDRIAVMDRLVQNLEIPADPLKQLTVFFMLQRLLFKWGGETLSMRSLEWRAFRTLFLLTAGQDIDLKWCSPERYSRWDRECRPLADQHIAHIAKSHAATHYESDFADDEARECLDYYDLERYVFQTVADRFHQFHELCAFDFFSIIIWKSNRAKTHTARRLLKNFPERSLEEIVQQLTSALHDASDRKARLEVLINDYGFLLPMASAVLTALWPEEFSVYDIRVCEQLRDFYKLGWNTKIDELWGGYERFVKCVGDAVPGRLSLRDKDRVLWARSAKDSLRQNLRTGFRLASPDASAE